MVSIPGKPGKTVAANVWRRNPKAPKSLANMDPAKATMGLAVVKDFFNFGRTYAVGNPECVEIPHSYFLRIEFLTCCLNLISTSEAVKGSTWNTVGSVTVFKSSW
jgi:hypothetical protein